MKRFNDNIEEHFYKSLSDFEELPDASIWQNINSKLDESVTAPVSHSRGIISKVIALAMMLALPFNIIDRRQQTGKNDNFLIGLNAETEKNKSLDRSPLNSESADVNQKVQPNSAVENNVPPAVTTSVADSKLYSAVPMNIETATMLSPFYGSLPLATLDNGSKTILEILKKFAASAPEVNTVKPMAPRFKPYWIVSPFISRDISYYRLVDDKDRSVVPPPLDSREVLLGRERHEPSYSGGILLTRQFVEHFAIQTGLIYSKQQIIIDAHLVRAVESQERSVVYKLNTSSGYAFFDPAPNATPVVGDSMNVSESQHNLEFLTIPVGIQLKKQWRKWSVLPAAGITANILTRALLKTEIENPNSEKVYFSHLYGLRKLYFGGSTTMGVRYQVNEKVSLDIAPSLRFSLTPITRKTEVENYPASFGIATGISIKF